MGTQVVPLRLDKESLEIIDELVKMGLFNSRSEALRELVKIGAKEYEKRISIVRAAELLIEMERKKGKIPLQLRGGLEVLLSARRDERVGD